MRNICVSKVDSNGFSGWIWSDELSQDETIALGLLPVGIQNTNYAIPLIGSFEVDADYDNYIDVVCFDITLLNPFDERFQSLSSDDTFDLDALNEHIRDVEGVALWQDWFESQADSMDYFYDR